MMKKKDMNFITTMLRGKDLVSGKTIVSRSLATMRGLFGILFAVVRFPRREGFEEENKKRKLRNITRFGCSAKLVIARNQNTGQ